MRIGDLVEQLSQLDPDMELVCYTENPVTAYNRQFVVLDPQDVSVADAIATRDDEGFLSFRFEKGEFSRRIAVMELSPDL